MSKKSPFLMHGLLHLTVTLLLAIVGFGVPETGSSFHYGDPLTAGQAQEHVRFSAESLGDEERQKPSLPEELPANGEEKKEVSEEKDTFDDDSLFLHFLAFHFSQRLSPSAFTHWLESSSGQTAVPLYVLFHCWKSFLS